jgi:hypothetical protein
LKVGAKFCANFEFAAEQIILSDNAVTDMLSLSKLDNHYLQTSNFNFKLYFSALIKMHCKYIVLLVGTFSVLQSLVV